MRRYVKSHPSHTHSASISYFRTGRDEELEKERFRSPIIAVDLEETRFLGEIANVLGKIRFHCIHRSRRFLKSMERDGWEIRW